MKKLLSVLLVLAVVSGAGIGVLAWRVNRTGEQVTVEETTLMGDKSAAEGVTVRAEAGWRNRLCWDISHTLGQTPEAQLTLNPEGEWHGPYSWEGVELRVSYAGNDLLEVVDHPQGLMKLGQELLERSKDGEEVRATADLGDYLEHYPIRFGLELPGVMYNGYFPGLTFETSEFFFADQEQTAKMFHDFFPIPIREEEPIQAVCLPSSRGDGAPESYELRLQQKDPVEEAENSAEVPAVPAVGMSEVDLVCAQDFTEDLCVFALTNQTQSGKPLDFSEVPGGYGLYGFTFQRVTDRNEHPNVTVEITDDTKTGVDNDSLRLMYPLPESALVTQVAIDERHQQVLVVTLDGGEGLVTVLDMKTMKAVQTIPVAKMAWPQLVLGDDFLVIYDGDGQLVLLTEADGRWRQRWTAELPEQLARNVRFSRVDWRGRNETVPAAMDVRGQELLLCDYADEFTEDCRYDVAVVNGDGVAYWGRFVTSLASYPEGVPGPDRQLDCRITTLDVAWPD